MNTTQKLQKFTNSELYEFLRNERNVAFLSWGVDDVIGKAKEMDIEVDNDTAIKIIKEIDRRADASLGISRDTLEFYINYIVNG